MSLKEAERPGSGRYRDGCCSEQMMRGRVSSTGNAGLVDYYRFASEMSVRHQYQRRDMRVSTLTQRIGFPWPCCNAVGGYPWHPLPPPEVMPVVREAVEQ